MGRLAVWRGRLGACCAVVVCCAVLASTPAQAQSASDSAVVVTVDAPADGAAVSQALLLQGWALDPTAELSTGVDRVEVYLDGPRDGGTPLGAALYGLPRADVGIARRSQRFNASGWALEALLPPGPHALYIYARQEGSAEDEGWSAPVVLAVRVEGSAIAVPTGRTPLGGSPPVTPAQGSLSQTTSGAAPPLAGCAVTDRDSGRCVVRGNRTNTAENAASAATPGSWTSGGGHPPSGMQGEVGLLGGLLSSTGFVYGTQLGASPAPSGGAPPAGATTTSTTATTAPPPPAAGSAPPAAGSAPASGASAAMAGISLSVAQTGRGQFTLNWNQVGGGALYEVRRCASLSAATLACSVVAVVQNGSYVVQSADGVYLVRAVSPQGQSQGESNRVQLCCRG